MIDAEFFISDPVVEHVPDDDEQRVLECDDGAQGPGVGLNAPVFHRKVGRFRPGHGQRRDSECCFQVVVAGTGFGWI